MLSAALLLFILDFVLFNSKPASNKQEEFFDRNTTDALRGICAIIIVLNHYAQHISDISLAGRIFMYSGSCTVGFFFLISGYANYLSYIKKSKSKYIWLKKVLKVFVIVQIINLIDGIFFQKDLNIQRFNIFNGGYWFIVVVMGLYIVLYLCMKWFKKYSIVSLLTITVLYMIILRRTGASSYWYNSVMCFTLGTAVAKYKKSLFSFFEKINIPLLMTLLLPVIVFMYYKCMTVGYPYDFLAALFFNLFIILYCYQFNLKSRIGTLLGTISLELYIWHGKMLYYLITVNGTVNNDFGQFLIFLSMSLSLSFLTKWIVNVNAKKALFPKNNII